jgi:hypothetical protein
VQIRRYTDRVTILNRRLRVVVAIACAIALAGVACDDDGDDPADDTPGVATRAPTVEPTPAPAPDIREIDLRQVPAVQNFLSETGGELEQETVIYADLTEDGDDEAIVPVTSGGTAGNIGFIVIGATAGGSEALARETRETGGLALAVEDGVLVVTAAVAGPDDPECCPSLLRETRYEWNGAALAITSSDTIPNPGAATATPAS